MTNLWQRLKQRKLVQWAVAYIAAAFALLQGVDIVAQQFGWPETLQRGITLAMVLGFCVALVLAWYHGEKGEQSVSTTELLILAVLLAIGGALMWRYARVTSVIEIAPVTTAGNTAVMPVANMAVPEKSIAVLAFADLSPQHDQDYFSDGIAEEILNALAQVKDLKVAGRTSSFSFKGKNQDLRVIGETLGVANVLEGSVRKQRDKVRITAQLIRSKDGFHLWSDTYDGDLNDVFALQERIAQSITEKLAVVLSDKQVQQLVNAGTSNPDAYALYLQASSIFNRRDRTHFLDAIAALQRAVQLDPHFARAFARLASLYVVLPSYTDADPRQAHEQVMRNAAAALALDTESAEAWAARGASLSKFRESQVQSRDAYLQAMRFNPNDPNAIFWDGLSLLTVGYRRAGTSQIEHALALDPMLPNALRWRGMLYLQDGDVGRAEPLLQRAYDLGLVNTASALSDIATLHGDTEASARLWMAGSLGLDFFLSPDELMTVHGGISGDSAAKHVGVQTLQGVLARMGKQRASPSLPLYLFRLDAPELGLKALRERQMGETIDAMNWIWTRQGAAVRAAPGFNAYLRAFHLPDVWDKYGTPDMCSKNQVGEYVCQ